MKKKNNKSGLITSILKDLFIEIREDKKLTYQQIADNGGYKSRSSAFRALNPTRPINAASTEKVLKALRSKKITITIDDKYTNETKL